MPASWSMSKPIRCDDDLREESPVAAWLLAGCLFAIDLVIVPDTASWAFPDSELLWSLVLLGVGAAFLVADQSLFLLELRSGQPCRPWQSGFPAGWLCGWMLLVLAVVFMFPSESLPKDFTVRHCYLGIFLFALLGAAACWWRSQVGKQAARKRPADQVAAAAASRPQFAIGQLLESVTWCAVFFSVWSVCGNAPLSLYIFTGIVCGYLVVRRVWEAVCAVVLADSSGLRVSGPAHFRTGPRALVFCTLVGLPAVFCCTEVARRDLPQHGGTYPLATASLVALLSLAVSLGAMIALVSGSKLGRGFVVLFGAAVAGVLATVALESDALRISPGHVWIAVGWCGVGLTIAAVLAVHLRGFARMASRWAACALLVTGLTALLVPNPLARFRWLEKQPVYLAAVVILPTLLAAVIGACHDSALSARSIKRPRLTGAVCLGGIMLMTAITVFCRPATMAEGIALRQVEHLGGQISSLAISPDGSRVFAAGTDLQGVFVWDFTGSAPPELIGQDGYAGHEPPSVWATALSPDGTTLAAACRVYGNGSESGQIRLWDAETLVERPPLRHRWPACWAAFSPDGTLLATHHVSPSSSPGRSPASGEVRLWNTRTWRPGDSLRLQCNWVDLDSCTLGTVGLAFSPDGGRLAIAEVKQYRDATICVWDISAGEVSELAVEAAGVPVSLWWSPDGKTLAAGTFPMDQQVLLYDPATGERKHADRRLRFGSIWANVFAFSADGLVAVGGGRRGYRFGQAKVWNLTDFSQRAELTILESPDVGTASITALAFSADGRTLVTASGDGSIRVWDLEGE